MNRPSKFPGRRRNCYGTTEDSLKAEKLLADTKKLINGNALTFYKNKHCPECQFWVTCHQKLKDKDCISLLGNISPITFKSSL